MVNSMEACTYRLPVSSDSSSTLQLLTLKRSRRVLSTFMQASLNETSLDVKPPPSIIPWFSSIRTWAWAESRATPSD